MGVSSLIQVAFISLAKTKLCKLGRAMLVSGSVAHQQRLRVVGVRQSLAKP